MDFSDGHGNPHLGPHILAGVNGSGKSTVLRAIAWAMVGEQFGFNTDEWQHHLQRHPVSRAVLALKHPSGLPYLQICGRGMESIDSWNLSSYADAWGMVAAEIAAKSVDANPMACRRSREIPLIDSESRPMV